MKRAIVQPADVSGTALSELKQWLGISREAEDALLTGLLSASLDLCEAFTRQMPLEAVCEELHSPSASWFSLKTAPVRAITAINAVAADGTRTPIDPVGFEVDILADGTGRARIMRPAHSGIVAVTFVAGLAAGWDALPETLKHGIIRLAAHHYLSRDAADRDGPPASVTALWRPWKRLGIQ